MGKTVKAKKDAVYWARQAKQAYTSGDEITAVACRQKAARLSRKKGRHDEAAVQLLKAALSASTVLHDDELTVKLSEEAGDSLKRAKNPGEAAEQYVFASTVSGSRLGDFQRSYDITLKAIDAYIDSGDELSAAEQHFMAASLAGTKLAEASPQIAQAHHLESVGHYEQAGDLFARNGQTGRAADCYEHGKQTARTHLDDKQLAYRLRVKEREAAGE